MKQSSSLKVFLCDLTHNTIILVSDTIPNINLDNGNFIFGIVESFEA